MLTTYKHAKKDATGFSMAYDEKLLVPIIDYNLWLLVPSQSWNITHHHQIMCGCEVCIQAGTYQELLNHWRKKRLIYINNIENKLTRVSVEIINAEYIESSYSNAVLSCVEKINLLAI